jgi:hypothetical protein
VAAEAAGDDVMAVYTVHEPRPRKSESAAAPERYTFVRDGFHFWAFLLGPLWMLWHRMWLVLVIYLIATTAIQVGLFVLGMSAAVKFTVGVLIAILVGCEAGTLRRWSLRRWSNVGVVVAPTREEAERRYFGSLDADKLSPSPPVPPDMSIPPPPSEVIGLFPEPQPRA